MIGRNETCGPANLQTGISPEKKGKKATDLQICLRGMLLRDSSIVFYITSRVLAWPAMR